MGRMKEKHLKITLEEAEHLIKKLEYTYKKKGSPFIDKVKKFIEEQNKIK